MSLSLNNGTIGHFKMFHSRNKTLSQTKNKIASHQAGDFLTKIHAKTKDTTVENHDNERNAKTKDNTSKNHENERNAKKIKEHAVLLNDWL